MGFESPLWVGWSAGSWGVSWGYDETDKPIEVYDSWRTEQGISPIRFEPVRSTTVTLRGAGANAQTSTVNVETSRETLVVLQGSGSVANSGCVEVSTGCVTHLLSYGASSGSRVSHVESSAVVRVYGAGSRSGAGRVSGFGSADVRMGSCFAGARSSPTLQVFTVKNPTDDELINIFLRRRYFQNNSYGAIS
jgi:hypothetical protein